MPTTNLERKVSQLDNDVEVIYQMLASIQVTLKRQGNRIESLGSQLEALDGQLESLGGQLKLEKK